MTQKKALRLLQIIVISSLVLLVMGFIFKRVKPEWYLKQSAKTPEALQAARHMLLDELPLQENDPAKTRPNERGILVWPETSMVPDYHKADLSIYRGRSKNEKALEGILVFIDAGKKEEVVLPSEASSSDSGSGLPVAATDPVTGLPISNFNNETMPTRSEVKPDIPRGEVLKALSQRIGDKLKELGAEVIYTRDLTESGSDVSQAALVGKTLSDRFIKELGEQKFKCTPLSELIPTMTLAMSDPAAAEVNKLFTSNGVGPDLRLILDVERQYSDVLFLSLRLGTSKEGESGSRVLYFGDSTAASIGAAHLSQERPSDQPAYLAYGSQSRRRLAEQIYRNISGLLPEFAYKGKQNSVAEAPLVPGRLSNVTSVELMVGYEDNEANMNALVKDELHKSMAEAVSHACYQFYCD